MGYSTTRSFHDDLKVTAIAMKFLVFGGGGRIALQFAKLAQGQHKVVGVVRNHKQ